MTDKDTGALPCRCPFPGGQTRHAKSHGPMSTCHGSPGRVLGMRREDLGSLAMFVAVAEERSFTRAAARLGISQSALSHAMRRLEARLSLRLLTRTTPIHAADRAGERLIETLGPTLDDIDAKLAALTELRERPAGAIRITTSQHAAQTLLWPVVDPPDRRASRHSVSNSTSIRA